MLGYSSQTLLSSDSEDSEEGLQNLELDETAEMPEKVVLRARKEDKPEIERHTGPTELQKLSKKLSLIDEIPPGPAWDSKKEFLAEPLSVISRRSRRSLELRTLTGYIWFTK